MSFLLQMVDVILHLDRYLTLLVERFGIGVYSILFLIVFCETGLVVTPILPGDSLLFAAGALAALGSMNIFLLWGLLVFAAILGDTVNYWIGRRGGNWIIERYDGKWIKHEHLERTHRFYEKHGAKMIVLARFVPIVRTFAPFVAGLGKMHYGTFIVYNIMGGFAWVSLFVFSGYFFGNREIVKANFSFVILGIIILSLVPMAWEIWRARNDKSVTS